MQFERKRKRATLDWFELRFELNPPLFILSTFGGEYTTRGVGTNEKEIKREENIRTCQQIDRIFSRYLDLSDQDKKTLAPKG